MAQENTEGSSYLLALKQSREGAVPTPKADPSEGRAQPSDPQHYEGVNKRRDPRYKCEGSAEVCEEDCEVHTWATFTDISLHGCYVEAQATYPVGSIINLKLETNGIRVETKANVRVNYPYLGMGIAFADMTEANLVNLRQMLATISYGCVVMGPGIASTIPSASPLGDLPAVSEPAAAIQDLIAFFESRQMLMREDFLRILRKSQKAKATR